MRIRNGIVTTLHTYSTDSEFTNVLKGRYITNVIDNNVIVLDNSPRVHYRHVRIRWVCQAPRCIQRCARKNH